MNALRYGNGSHWGSSHDASYRLTESRISGAYEKHYGYDDRDLITAVDDALDAGQSLSFGYDALARLTDADQPSAQQDFSYDGVGNRLSKIENASAESYSYQPATHKLDAISGSRSTAFSYDAIGNITAYDGKLLSYNQAGRLAQVSDNNSVLYSNRYSADGHRVIKADESGSTVFLYGPDGQLIAEHRQDGTPIREYIYLNGKLVGLTSKRNVELPSGDLNEGPVGGLLRGTTGELPDSPASPEWELFYVVTDHLGSPRVIQDYEPQTVWQAHYQPFGEVDISTKRVTMPLRFPGQYHDGESGIYQNWWRDYDPTLGRYLQSDPIGLVGGLNSYGYVGQNPVSFVDPFGLERTEVSVGGSLPFVGGFSVGLFVTDGDGDAGCNTDFGMFLQVNAPLDGKVFESGIGRFKLGGGVARSRGGRGDALESGAEFVIGGAGLGVVVGSPTGSQHLVDAVGAEGGVLIAYGAEKYVNFSLSLGDLGRLLAAGVTGDTSQRIFGSDPGSSCECR